MAHKCPTCGDEFDTLNGRNVHHAQVHGESITHVERTCKRCGDTFERHKTYADKGHDKYCSRDCSNKSDMNRTIQECGNCGNEYEVKRSQIKHRGSSYCCWECYTEGRTMENINYGAIWQRKRKQALVRDDYQCQHCGIGESEIGHSPDVHHIVGVRLFQNIRAAHILSNLITLCKSCHKKAEYGSIECPKPTGIRPQV